MEDPVSNEYLDQLKRVVEALKVTPEGEDRNNLLALQNDLKQLLELTKTDTEEPEPDDEYALFMAEMAKEGAIKIKTDSSDTPNEELLEHMKSIEGTKCRAPYNHSWGDIVYHNALVTSIQPLEGTNYEEITVKVLFINPTHKDMLPCPFFLETECKFSDDKCRFSHGEIVLFSDLQEYIEPDYQGLDVGSFILAKKEDKLWHKGVVKKVLKEKCLVKLESNNSEELFEFCDIHPLNDKLKDEDIDSGNSDNELNLPVDEDIINKSLLIKPSEGKLGQWEIYTKGIGSKLMEKMGYVIGTGLGKQAEGRIEPVTAEILPAGKSLDHCMTLRERAGGDKNLFNVERKLKRLKRRQEIKNLKNYQRESKKVDVFEFMNKTLAPQSSRAQLCKTKHRKEIKQESSRTLNVECFKLEQTAKELERELGKIKQSISRQSNSTALYKQLNAKFKQKEQQLSELNTKLLNIKNEQSLRNTTNKLTKF